MAVYKREKSGEAMRKAQIDEELRAAMMELRRLGVREDGLPEETSESFGLPKEILDVFDEIVLEKSKRGQVFDKDSAVAGFAAFGHAVQTQAIVPVRYDQIHGIAGTQHAYVSGIINQGNRADINTAILGDVLVRVDDKEEFTLHLVGFGTTPAYVNPRWYVRFGEAYKKAGHKIFLPGQPRPDISIHVDASGAKTLYGMKFTPSNFVPYARAVTLQELGVTLEGYDRAVVDLLVMAEINATEKLIQLPKNLAALMPRLTSQDGDYETKFNLFKDAAAATDPKLQKKCGRKAQLNPAFFKVADGRDIDVYDPQEWTGVGTNILIQAFGGLLRIFTCDTILRDLLEFCSKHSITIVEAALHGEVESGGRKISYGGDPDTAWGGSLVYPWMCRETATYSKVLNGGGVPVSAGKNHLGLGYKLLMHAMEPLNAEHNRAARRALGVDESEPILTGDIRDKCRLVAERTFGRLFQAGYGGV